jgi:hypothetical protein
LSSRERARWETGGLFYLPAFAREASFGAVSP